MSKKKKKKRQERRKICLATDKEIAVYGIFF